MSKDAAAFDTASTKISNLEEKLGIFITIAIILVYLCAYLARSKCYWPGGVIGAVLGFIFAALTGAVLLGLWGLLKEEL